MLLKLSRHLNAINFSFGTNGKLKVLVVPVLKHFKASAVLTSRSINYLLVGKKIHVPNFEAGSVRHSYLDSKIMQTLVSRIHLALKLHLNIQKA